ncbi:E3 ubiquitin-protein ligase RNF8 isoform X4 [Saccopteryx leptura]|uniref:E3 ubiquitin-protein ligase RNF8 isoform X4 n=1 Tax=Saccopteryx leptura TaxID=249018 RepID=UPI00339BB7BC
MGEPGSRAPRGRPGGRSWCLRRVGLDAEWLLLEEGQEVTLGRGFGVTYQLLSKLSPLMISRKHCVLKQNPEGQWTIMDNKSLNGVWLNRVRLQSLEVYPIHKGDRIQLGVPLDNKAIAEYEYEVTEDDWVKLSPRLAPTSERMVGKNKGLRTKRKCSSGELEGPEAEGPSHLKSKMSKESCGPSRPLKSHGKGEAASQASERLGPKSEPSESSAGARARAGPAGVLVPHHKKQKASNPPVSQGSLEMFKLTMSRILKLKTEVQEKQVAVLNKKQQPQKGDLKVVVKMEQELQELQSQLCTVQAQQQALVEQLERTFQGEQQRLQEEKEKVQAQKEEVLSHMNDLLENELQCIICSEYFIEAVTLNCAHSYCSYCINEWMKRKGECPICRKDIKSKTPSLVLDNCVSKIVDTLSSEVKGRRIDLIKRRKGSKKGRSLCLWRQQEPARKEAGVKSAPRAFERPPGDRSWG